MAKIVFYSGKVPLNTFVWYDPKRKLLEFEIGTYENFRFTETPDPIQTGELVNRGDLREMARRCKYLEHAGPDDEYALEGFERWYMNKIMNKAMFNACLRVGCDMIRQGQTQAQAADAMEVTLELMKAGR